MTAMMDNMAPFLFALIAFGVALTVTMTGMAATRQYLAWLWLGIMLFFGRGGCCWACPHSSPGRPRSDHAARAAQSPRRSCR